MKTLAKTLFLGGILAGCAASNPAGSISSPEDSREVNLPPVVFKVEGLVNSSVPVRSNTWTFTCSSIPCAFRYQIGQNPVPNLGGLSFGSMVNQTTVTQPSGEGTYYLHVQSRDSLGNESQVKTVSAVLDNTPPTIALLSDHSTPSPLLTWSWGCSEDPCTYQFVIDQSSNTIPLSHYSSVSSTSKMGAAGTYYLHLRAKDRAGNTSSVAHFSGQIDSGIFKVSGKVQFEWVPVVTNASGGALNYSAEQLRPARRVLMEVIEPLSGGGETSLGFTSTNDSGDYEAYAPLGKTVKVRVHSRLKSDSYLRDGVGLEECHGSGWDVRVVDNTQNRAGYVMTSSSSYSGESTGVDFRGEITRASNRYTNRSAAPFALLDTILQEIELVCQADAQRYFPLVYVNWSEQNEPTGDGSLSDKSLGRIVTSHYTVESVNGQFRPNLYILGKEDVDTDELDGHVVAHEFGHYLEDQLYRSDSIGGPHSLEDLLDPRLAFGEGFGNAISAMTFDDPIYIDTSGSRQAFGFNISMDIAPTGKNRSVFSERSSQYLLWKLFKNRGGFDRIHTVLSQDHVGTSALTSLHSFSAYYRDRYSASDDDLSTLYSSSTRVFSPIDSLCQGSCTGGVLDIFDQDLDLGNRYGISLTYGTRNSAFPAPFWNLYPSLSFGSNVSDHYRTARGGYSYPLNKMGMNRWYAYTHAQGTRMIDVRIPSLPDSFGGCSPVDALDLEVYESGALVVEDSSSTGCPKVQFIAEYGKTYVIVVVGYESEVSRYEIKVAY